MPYKVSVLLFSERVLRRWITQPLRWENGAAAVDLIIRRKAMPRINKMTGIGSQGVVHGMHVLADHWKWRFVDYTTSTQTRRRALLRCEYPVMKMHASSLIVA